VVSDLIVASYKEKYGYPDWTDVPENPDPWDEPSDKSYQWIWWIDSKKRSVVLEGQYPIPVSRMGYMSFAECVQTIGKSIFKGKWTVFPILALGEAERFEACGGNSFVNFSEELLQLEFPFLSKLVSRLGFLNYNALCCGYADAALGLGAISGPILKRYQTVFHSIIDQVVSEQIGVVWRDHEGGEFLKFNRFLLNIDCPPTCLLVGRTCETYVTSQPWVETFDPDLGNLRVPAGHLFLDGFQFTTWLEKRYPIEKPKTLNSQPQTETTAIGETSFQGSEYLKFMLEMTQKMGLTPENQIGKDAVMAQLKAAWKGSVDLSRNDLNSMATLLREPESKLGRGRKPTR
jgi:hypothetical protein